MASNVTTPTAMQQTPNKLSKANLFVQNQFTNTMNNGNIKLDKVIIQVLNGESEEDKPMNSPAMLQTSFDQSQLPQSPQNHSTIQDSVNLFSGIDEQENRGETKQHTMHSDLDRNSTEYNHAKDLRHEQILYNTTTEFDNN